MGLDDFLSALYDPEHQVKRSYNKLEFVKSTGTICNLKITKRALNAAYAKLYTSDLVQCKSWDYFLIDFCFQKMRTFT